MNSPQPDTRQIIFDALRVSWNDRVLEEAVTWPEAEAVLEALRAAGGVVVYPNHPDTIEAVERVIAQTCPNRAAMDGEPCPSCVCTAERVLGVLRRNLPRRLRHSVESSRDTAERWTVRPIFAWYDLWVGVFIDRARARIYVFPLPCLGLVIARRSTETPREGES